jgi:hypothetical protein
MMTASRMASNEKGIITTENQKMNKQEVARENYYGIATLALRNVPDVFFWSYLSE